MGIVANQGIRNSIISLLGILIGAVNTLIFFPEFLTEEEFGLTRLIISISAVVAQFFSLGSAGVSMKFFPFFKDKEQGHFGFLSILLMLSLFGFLVFLAIALIFKPEIIVMYDDQSSLFKSNYGYFIIYSLFILFFTVLDAYSASILKTVFANFLRTVLIRVLWLVLILCYGMKLIDFDVFLLLFVLSYGVLLLTLVIYLVWLKEFHLTRISKSKLKSKSSEMLSFGKYSILSAVVGYTANYIDSIMIVGLTDDGLKNVAIYFIAFYIGSMIMIPYSAVGGIISNLVARKMKEDDIESVGAIYLKSTNLLLIISLLLFFCLFLNIDNLLSFMKESYQSGKWVIIFIAITKLYESCTTLNGNIIQLSKYYKYLLTINVSLIVLVIITNLLLIPYYGIEGAALATLLTMSAVNTVRIIILKVKLNIQTFNFTSLRILAIALLAFGITEILPLTDNILLNIVITSGVFSTIYLAVLFVSKTSVDFNEIIFNFLKKFKKK